MVIFISIIELSLNINDWVYINNIMNLEKFKKSYNLNIIFLIIIVIFIGISTSFVIVTLLDDSDNISDNKYNMKYTGDTGIVISQKSGASTNLTVNLIYKDGYKMNESIKLNGEGDNYYIPINKRDSTYIKSVKLYGNSSGEQILFEKLDSQTDELDSFNINDYSVSHTDNINISASDYISRTEDIESYKWNINDEYTLNGESIVLDSSEISAYNITLETKDKFGNEESDSFNISIDGNSNNITSNPNIYSDVNKNISFTGENSIADSNIESYEWDFDDGNTKEGENVKHSYSESGTYNVTLKTEDSSGNSHSKNIGVVVFSELVSQITIDESDEFNYTYNASESQFNTTEVDDVTYYWTFGDGENYETKEPVVNHTYDSPGEYSVFLTVGSDNGLESTTETTINTEFNIVFDNEMPYIITEINDDYKDSIIPNNDVGDEWPEISFIESTRYKLTNLPSDIELVDDNDNVLLSQRQDGSFEDNEEVNWVDDGDTVEFTVTGELGDELYGYRAVE